MSSRILPFLYCLLTISCGLGGDTGSSGKKEKPVEIPQDERPQANIEINTTLSLLKPSLECPSAVGHKKIPFIAAHGLEALAMQIPENGIHFYAQRVAEQRENESFDQITLAQSSEFLEIYIQQVGEKNSEKLSIQLGALKQARGAVIDEYIKTLELQGSRVFVNEYGKRYELSSEYFDIKRQAGLTHLRLLHPVVGFVTGLHAWWMTIEDPEMAQPFHMSRMILPPLEDKINPEFLFFDCNKKHPTDNKGQHTFEVIDARLLSEGSTRITEETQSLRSNTHYIHKALYALQNDFGLRLFQYGTVSPLITSNSIIKKGYNARSRSYPIDFLQIKPDETKFSSYRSRSEMFQSQLEQIGSRTLRSFMPLASDDLIDYLLYLMVPKIIKKYDGELFYTETIKKNSLTVQTAKNLATITSHVLNGNIIIDTLKNSEHMREVAVSDFILAISSQLAEETSIQLLASIDGWYNDRPFQDKFGPTRLNDEDSDGLIELLETIVLGTLDERFDSDDDGWSDLSEYLYKTEPMNEQHHPAQIIEDGGFGDWMRLLRKKINIDPDLHSSECSASEDITHYGVKSDDDMVAIAAKILEPVAGNVGNIKWRIPVVFQNSKIEFSIQAHTNTNTFSLIDTDTAEVFYTSTRGYDIGRYGVEFVLDKREILDLISLKWPERSEQISALEKNPLISAKFSILKKQREYVVCDETSWADEI